MVAETLGSDVPGRMLAAMAEGVLPTGTVTFLFSDMEGSTRLVQDLGPAVFTEVIERHNAVLREAFGRHGATERGTQGDSFLVMFQEAPAAVAAAADAQRALAATEWPASAGVRVRMGLHTGIARLGGDDYVGVDVNRAARICGLGHGGQVLLSDATRALTADDIPDGVSVRSLGSHRLRDLDRAEPLHQLVIEGLPSDFPPLAAADGPVGNLPRRLTSFVGRDRELETLERLLDESTLVTLTGPGGAGKTRLAIETARRRAASFADGAWLVRLEGIEDPELVLDAIAGTCSLVESPQTTPLERLQAFLAGRSILLVLDNFEHLMPAAARIHALLERAGPDLRVIVTSRAPLRIGPEQEFPVGRLDASDAIGLFVERARRADPSFGLTDDNRGAVSEICDHLDGLPLGIELAASRIGLLPAAVIADQLTRRLDLPGVAPATCPLASERSPMPSRGATRSSTSRPGGCLSGCRCSPAGSGSRSSTPSAGRRAYSAPSRSMRSPSSSSRAWSSQSPGPTCPAIGCSRRSSALAPGASPNATRRRKPAIGTPGPTLPSPRKLPGTCRAAINCHGSTG